MSRRIRDVLSTELNYTKRQVLNWIHTDGFDIVCLVKGTESRVFGAGMGYRHENMYLCHLLRSARKDVPGVGTRLLEALINLSEGAKHFLVPAASNALQFYDRAILFRSGLGFTVNENSQMLHKLALDVPMLLLDTAINSDDVILRQYNAHFLWYGDMN